MSEFWKKRSPRLTAEEERALWERVRTMPSEGVRARSPWATLWAKPAVRYGAPVFAVALVAVVWVAQRNPGAPRESVVSTMPYAKDTAGGAAATRSLEPPAAVTVVPQAVEPEAGSRGANTAPPAERRADVLEEEAQAPAMDGTRREAQVPAPAPAPATAPFVVDDRARATAGSAAPQTAKLQVLRKESEESAAGLASGEIGADEVAPAVSFEGEYAARLYADVVRFPGSGASSVTVKLPSSGRIIQLARDAGGRFIYLEEVTEGAADPPGVLERRTALAIELVQAIEAEERASVDRITGQAGQLVREFPADEGAQALVAWTRAAQMKLRGH